jgi:putative transposase
VPARLSPTERIRAQIDELFAGGQPLAETLEEVARLSVRLVIQAALEAEVSEFLGRDRYQRDPDAGPGHRNGHQPVQVKTIAGPVVLERPKAPRTTQPFVSRLLGKGVSRTNAPEALVLASFVRGLSVRDVEAALAEALGPEAALSKSTVRRICQAIKEEFDAFTTRDLGGVEVDYLFLDGTHFRYHPGAPAEPILVAWGVTITGGPVLLGLAPGSDEGTDPWTGRAPGGPGRSGAGCAAAGDHRWRTRADRRGRVGVPVLTAATLPDPPCPQCPGQGPQPRPGRGQGGVLGDLRRHRRPTRRPSGHRGPPTR